MNENMTMPGTKSDHSFINAAQIVSAADNIIFDDRIDVNGTKRKIARSAVRDKKKRVRHEAAIAQIYGDSSSSQPICASHIQNNVHRRTGKYLNKVSYQS